MTTFDIVGLHDESVSSGSEKNSSDSTITTTTSLPMRGSLTADARGICSQMVEAAAKEKLLSAGRAFGLWQNRSAQRPRHAAATSACCV